MGSENASKPVKVGIKLFVVADSHTGYCWDFQIYVGKAAGTNEDDVGQLGKTDCVVISLVKNLAHQGHHLYLDNFYTSVALFVSADPGNLMLWNYTFKQKILSPCNAGRRCKKDELWWPEFS